MLVAIVGFGSVWRHRAGKPTSNNSFTHPVYYNTTGIRLNDVLRQRARICGYARFDSVGGFEPTHLSRMINRVFECAEPSVWMGCNKLLFRRMLKAGERPHAFLLVARSELTGHLPIGTDGWRSRDSWILAFSEWRNQQELMLLMPIGGWIRTALGELVLESSEARPWVARLVLSIGK